MNKNELIDAVSDKAGLFKRDAKIAVETVVECIVDGLKEDGKVNLTGFGAFTVKERNARVARNPKTGDLVPVPAHRVPAFKAAQKLRDDVQ